MKPQTSSNTSAYFLWETTGSMETKKSLNRMYPSVPMIVIRNAIDSGVRNFEGLKKCWDLHNINVAKSKAGGREKSTRKLKYWSLHG